MERAEWPAGPGLFAVSHCGESGFGFEQGGSRRGLETPTLGESLGRCGELGLPPGLSAGPGTGLGIVLGPLTGNVRGRRRGLDWPLQEATSRTCCVAPGFHVIGFERQSTRAVVAGFLSGDEKVLTPRPFLEDILNMPEE